jgi:transposase InsO family protein
MQGLVDAPRKDRGPKVLTEAALAYAESLLVENRRRNTDYLLTELERQCKIKVGRSTLNRHLHARGVCRRVHVEDAPGPPFRAFEAPGPNALWHSDVHHGPPVLSPDGSKVVKSYVIAWVDDHARVCCHGEVYAADNCNALLDALRKAMRKWGVPERTCTDNGSIYSGLQFHLVCADLHIVPWFTKVASPWQNGKMERLWGVAEDQFFSEVALLPPMPLEKLNHYVRAWVEAEYHTRIHSQTRQTPLERWYQYKPALRHPTPEQEQRLFWLWERRKVSTTGVIQLFKNRYFADPTLADKWVVVRYDPENLARIQTWDNSKHPKLLGDAIATPLVTRRHDNPPPPKDAGPASPAAQRRLEAIEARFQAHLAQSLGLTRFDTQEEN